MNLPNWAIYLLVYLLVILTAFVIVLILLGIVLMIDLLIRKCKKNEEQDKLLDIQINHTQQKDTL